MTPSLSPTSIILPHPLLKSVFRYSRRVYRGLRGGWGCLIPTPQLRQESTHLGQPERGAAFTQLTTEISLGGRNKTTIWSSLSHIPHVSPKAQPPAVLQLLLGKDKAQGHLSAVCPWCARAEPCALNFLLLLQAGTPGATGQSYKCLGWAFKTPLLPLQRDKGHISDPGRRASWKTFPNCTNQYTKKTRVMNEYVCFLKYRINFSAIWN